ncbi:MAG TPA: hypothetical protein VHK88_16780 [Aquihabitans sp.]|jgi:hypothetical protein|nr:hypothetical protein [Aquihabitans sp.]
MTATGALAAEILGHLRAGHTTVPQLHAALEQAVLGYGDLSSRSDPAQVGEAVLGAVRRSLVEDPHDARRGLRSVS